MSASVLTLGPSRREPLPGCPGFYVRIGDDLRETVLFLGFEDKAPGKGGINCVGTGFLLNYDECGYIVTARHLAHGLGDNPFLVRVNRKDGTSENILADEVRWFEHPDPNVDVAVTPFAIGGGPGAPYQVLYLPGSMMATDAIIKHEKLNALGVGDFTYTIGLFRLLSGERRNLPVVHFGTVAMMPGDERIPVRDWRDKTQKLMVEGYLIETQAMQGLSGSPVFVRPTTTFNLFSNALRDPRHPVPPDFMGLAPVQRLFLLGLWSGSWDAPPDEVLAVQAGQQNRVPVGMGIVVSAQKIKETLEQEELIAMRKEVKRLRAKLEAANAATTDSAIPTANPDVHGAPPASDANPRHREDFTSLVGAAARKREQED
jgi:hypothetical protein